MTELLHRYVGPLPDLARIYAPELDLTSDTDWLRGNPNAVARIRAFRDDTRTDKRVILLTVRVLDPALSDGWRLAHVEGHSAHWGSPAFQTWQSKPGDPMAANDLALSVLTSDTDVEAGHAMTALSGLVLPELSELPPHWRSQFPPINARPAA